MIKSFLIFSVSLSFLFSSCGSSNNSFGVTPYHSTEAGLNWYKVEDLEKMSNIEDRTVLVDLYTDWCGWCKKMDKNTFTDPEVVKFLNENFVLVKFNAEQKETINFKGEVYETIPRGRKPTNKLAIKFLNGRMSYPSFVYLDGANLDKIKISVGYKKPKQLITELQKLLADNEVI